MYILAAIITVTLAVFVGWRLASRRRSLPCPVWLRWLVELDNPFTRTNRAAVIIGHLDLAPGMSVLDAGCGPGRLTIPLAEQVGPGGKVVAVDIQEGMLHRARERANKAGLENIQFVQASLGEGRLEKDGYDRALLVTVLGEIPDREAAMREIFATLRPGGILSITEIMFDPHFQRRTTVSRLAQRTGFRELRFFGNAIAYTAQFSKPGNEEAFEQDGTGRAA